ncbi:hypothetical protein DPMN_191122 [Dreissena polymorpha]|uniref:Uncharacterized protein n=1 Tax=Dreissena polymorpha TaxID=45954 RepID=A0A9D3XZ55_DREPO|nr:hypothetical protein DPMN_191122 [Dreissena polymorpha]
MQDHMGKGMTKRGVASIACKVYFKAVSPLNISSVVKKARIFPLQQKRLLGRELSPM